MDTPRLFSLHRQGDLCQPGETSGTVVCLSCAHRCRIPEGGSGRCLMRVNRGGTLLVPHGYVSALNCDPVEKKPFFHFMPGENALSFGMLGCNFHCPFCQNWTISQSLRDPQASLRAEKCSAEEIVAAAGRSRCRIVASTYNEPLISNEWAVEIFKLAKADGLANAYVSNGFASPEALDYVMPWLDAANIDLKCFSDDSYRPLGGRLQPVLDTIRTLHENGKWVEITTLLVPGFNDSPEEISRIARFVAATNPDIPWHVSAYHANYKYRDAPSHTPAETVEKAVAIGRDAGLKFVYSGNLPGFHELADTRCPACRTTLVSRRGFTVQAIALDAGACPGCGERIPGRWS